MQGLFPINDNGPKGPKSAHNPFAVEVTRGSIVESRHTGSVAIVESDGSLVAGIGDVKAPVYPRSATKALQAIAVVETAGVDRIHMTDSEISFLCSSHGGEPRHVEAAASLLTRMGLSEADLECGPHWPSHEESARNLAIAGRVPDQLHNNCSGKHSGMLCLAQTLKAPTKGYIELTHPVQQRIMGVMEAMTGYALDNVPVERDGCSVPTWAIPLENLAYGFARFGRPNALQEARQQACKRIREAVFSDPFMVAGTDRYCTDVMNVLSPRAFLKTGAEGVFCASLPDRGLGIALKCDDGSTRGAEMMMTMVLDGLGVLTKNDKEALADRLAVPVKNRRGFQTGIVRPDADFLRF